MIAKTRIGLAVIGLSLALGAMAAQDPTATLRPDALDAPAGTSVRDAQRAAELAASGHVMSHGTYRQVDAGRDDVPATSPVGDALRGSAPGEQTAPPQSAPDPHAGHRDPHAGHDMAPKPSPSPKENR